MAIQPIEDRIRGSLRAGAINGDTFERSICEKQMREAADEIVLLRVALATERASLALVSDAAKKVLNAANENGRDMPITMAPPMFRLQEALRNAEEPHP